MNEQQGKERRAGMGEVLAQLAALHAQLEGMKEMSAHHGKTLDGVSKKLTHVHECLHRVDTQSTTLHERVQQLYEANLIGRVRDLEQSRATLVGGWKAVTILIGLAATISGFLVWFIQTVAKQAP